MKVFKDRYGCILHTMQVIIDDPHDGRERAECVGLLQQLKCLSFIMLLWVFNHILGITKILSDTLQSKELDLAMAVDLVALMQKCLSDSRTSEYFHEKIWLNVEKTTHSYDIHISSTEKRIGRIPSHLQEALILDSIGTSSHVIDSNETNSRILYYSIIDQVLSELHR